MSIKTHLDAVKSRIQIAENTFHREPHSVFLLAVSKKQPIEAIEQAIAAGQFAFGENYLQEALPKIAAFSHASCEWHFIGSIQRNKTKKIAEQFSWVHTVANDMIAKRLNDQRPANLPPLNICIEVNVSEESSKSGMKLADVEKLAAYCTTLPRLKLRGLMTIPEITSSFEEQRAAFHPLTLCRDNLLTRGFPLDTLSMGMSADLEAAIAEGATIVRVGTAIFGQRTR